MLPDALTWPDWTVWIIGFAAILAALRVILRAAIKLVRGMKTVGGWFAEIVRNEVTEIVDARLTPIYSELSPNGGTSLKDQVTHIGTEVRSIRGDLENHIALSEQAREELQKRLEQGGS